MRPIVDKVATIRDFTLLATTKDLERFCFILLFLRSIIPSRADLVATIKSTIILVLKVVILKGGRTRIVRDIVNF